MFLVRTNQNLTLDLYNRGLDNVYSSRVEGQAWIEKYCLRRNINIDVFKNILLNIYIVEWNLLCRSYNRKNAFNLIRKITYYYNDLKKNYQVNLTNINYYEVKPYIFDRNFRWESSIFNITNDNNKTSKFWLNLYSWNNLVSNIHFVRVQRRYNKRRYGRARVVSRPSFWCGSLLSSMGLGMFWGATSQMTDWINTQLIYVDVTNLLIIIYIYILWRIATLIGRGSLYSTRGNFHINQGFRTIIQKNFDNSRWWK
jgi:hypothetical protein